MNDISTMDELELELDFELPPQPARAPPFPRKRSRLEYEPATSSDPALFSSDEQAPSAESYVSKRRKEVYVGTWWGAKARDAAEMKRKRSFRRNYDSGIYLGSEGTDTGLEDQLVLDMEKKEHELTNQSQRKRQRMPMDYDTALDDYPRPTLLSPRQHQVRGVVQRCLEDGNENVDLSAMSLDCLPPDVAGLKSLIKHSPAALPSTGSQNAYSSIEAYLRVYLSNNLFTRLPAVILDLTNLRLLSLRQNNLTALPPGIRELVNLETLNIGGNQIRYLPFEVLRLIQSHSLRQLFADPNPWTVPPASTASTEPTLVNHRFHATSSTRLAVGAFETFRANGTVDLAARERQQPPANATDSRCPGLAEMALRRIIKLQSLSNLEDWVSDDIPDTVQAMLATARDTQTSGGRQCTTCGQSIILPRKQWIEWWRLDLDPKSGVQTIEELPFLRQQCHSRCAGGSGDHVLSHLTLRTRHTPASPEHR